MGTVVDTSVLIASERGHLDPERLVDVDEQQAAVIAAITASELLQGVHRVPRTAIRLRRERFVETVLTTFTVIAFNLDIARVHAQLAAELSTAGTPVGEADLMIGATAVWLDYRVATRDLRSFPKIRGLEIVRW